MRALVLSDIHSNIDALEAVMAAAPPYDVVWNLGDLVGYNAAPNAVLERVQQLRDVSVRGNHDRACCGLYDAENFNSIALAAVRWTQRQLNEGSVEWLRALPKGPIYISAEERTAGPHSTRRTLAPGRLSTPVVRDGESTFGRDDKPDYKSNPCEIACVHGSLRDEDQYLASIADAEEQPIGPDCRITFFGHTHIQGGFAANADGEWMKLRPMYSKDDAAESYALDLRGPMRYLINPGSVGQPRDRDWRAAFALYDDEADRVTYYRVPYDVRLAQMRIQRAGLPEMLASRLRVGR